VQGVSAASTKWGIRFFLSYGGSAPTGANCATLASDISSAWATHVSPLYPSYWLHDLVDVIDIATTSGFSGFDTTSHNGTLSGTALPLQVATNVEYDISNRYRGGKPRMYLPGAVEEQLVDQSHYEGSFVTTVNSGVSAFFTAVEALTIGSMGTLQHVLLSYYDGFENYTDTSGRNHNRPKYRTPNAVHFNITGYSCKAELSTQDRRRTATTP
jgi:hypothetical protein